MKTPARAKGMDGKARGAGRGGRARSRSLVGNRARGRLLGGGRPSGEGGGDLAPRAAGRLFDREGRGGEPLGAGLRRQMERAFDADFSGVRLIRRSSAAVTLGAEAVTRNERVHLAPGRFSPGNFAGRALIGHELAHVVQQRQGRVKATAQAKGVGINQNRTLEAEADAAGDRAARGLKAGLSGKGLGRGPMAPVAQCKVGMEYQATSDGGTGVAKYDGSDWVRPKHGEIISEETDFTVETDFDDIEYVLSAKDERNDGEVDKLVTASATAAAIHKKITDTHALQAGDLDVDDFADKTDYYEVKAKKSGTLYRLYKDGRKKAHPQATVGIRLDKLADFMDKVGNTSTSDDGDWKKMGYGRRTDKRRTSEQKMLRETVAAVRSQIGVLDSHYSVTMGDDAAGFLAMLVQYVRGTTDLGKPNTQNAKNAYSLMGRTSIRAMYDTLNQSARQIIWAILTDLNFKNVRKYLFGAELTGDIVVASEKGGKKTLWDLRKSLEEGSRDPMSTFSGISSLDTDATGWEKRKTDYGISRPTDIGYDSDDTKVHGAIIEMRALGRNVEPDRWSEVAASVAAVVKAQNS